MSTVHAVIGISLLGANAVAAGWGGIAWLRKRPSVGFWYALRVAQATVVVQAIVGFLLFAQGNRPADDLHVLYGIAPLFVSLFAEGMRAGAAQQVLAAVPDVEALSEDERRAVARDVVLREMAVMTIGALLIVTLALRAIQSGGL
jgi:hypothetical protein